MRLVEKFYLLTLLLPLTVAASGSVSGYVENVVTGKGIERVSISLPETDLKTMTEEDGYFIIENIPAGVYRLRAVHPSYEKIEIDGLVIEADANTEIMIRLKPKQGAIGTKIKNMSGRRGKEQEQSEERKHFQTRTANKNIRETKENRTIPDAGDIEAPAPPPVGGNTVPDIRGDAPSAEYSIKNPQRLFTPASSGLQAGYADDNQQFNYFLQFLEKYEDEVEHYPLKIDERIQLVVKDRAGKPLPNVRIILTSGKHGSLTGRTHADGSFYIYPLEYGLKDEQIRGRVSLDGLQKVFSIKRSGRRKIEINWIADRPDYKNIPLDLLFILDATGSMGEEIERLKSAIELINLNISALNIKPAVRYGMVLYRDREDAFVTKTVPFTADIDAFSATLNAVKAEGGGDDPEDLQAALNAAIRKMQWDDRALRLAFVVTDAPAHLDYNDAYTYRDAAREAQQKAIKIFAIGAGGLNLDGEYILRQIAQFTGGRFVFLNYGEQGESEGGRPGSVSHHTGSNYNTERLESLIIRFIKEELHHLSDIPIAVNESYFRAVRIPEEDKRATLEKLFLSALRELDDYSAMPLPDDIPVSVIPISVKTEGLKNNAEYFSARLVYALSRYNRFQLIERNDMQFVAAEVGLQLSGLIKLNDAVRLGSFVGAELLIIGSMYFKENFYEVYLKLVRVETAEVLAVTKLKIDYRLGL